MPEQLPVITLQSPLGDRSRYFVDVRLEEIRDIDNPHRRISFDELSCSEYGYVLQAVIDSQ